MAQRKRKRKKDIKIKFDEFLNENKDNEFYELDFFNNWDDVYDYESDYDTVILLDKNGNVIETFQYDNFQSADFDYYKNKDNG